MSSVLNRLQNSQPAAKAGSKSYNTFGLVLEVDTVKEEAGQLRITGTAVNSNSHVANGDPLSVVFRGDNAGKSITNFDKGNGKAWRKNEKACAGTIVTLESCYMANDADGNKVVNARWLNTLRNVNKADHEDRSSLEGVLALAPRVTFDNPNPQPNEPARIILPVVGDKAFGRVTTDQGTFRREFPAADAIAKLKALPVDAKIRVQIDIAEPRESINVTSKAELVAALTEQLGRGTDAISVIRVSDGEQTLTRSVHVGFKKEGGEYVPDVQKAISDLFSNNVFTGVDDTDAVFSAVAAGEATMEAVPCYRLSFAGNAAQDDNASYKLVNDLKTGRTQRYEMIFGEDAARYAAVILPGMIRGNGESMANFQPINLIGDEHGTYDVKEFSTPHIAPGAKAAPGKVPLEDADPSQSHSSGDIATAFDNSVSASQRDDEAPAMTP